MPEEKRDWKRVPVPKDLMDTVDDLARRSGYASSAEFVRDAIRRLIQEINGSNINPFQQNRKPPKEPYE